MITTELKAVSLAFVLLVGAGCQSFILAPGIPALTLSPLSPVGEAVDGPFFEDATDEVGIGGGSDAAWGDFNNDGWVDVYLSGGLWQNNEGKFAQVDSVVGGGKGFWGDYDNDGFLDIFTAASGKLFHNLGGQGFEDVTNLVPERGEHVSRGAVWGDFNNDSYLDIYYAGYEVWEPSRDYADILYLNEGGTAFKKHWESPAKERARGVTAADFDNDGDLDVYVSNYRLQPNNLWLNDGAAGFTNVGGARKVDGDGDLSAWGHTIGSAFGDLDNDGLIDIFVGNFSHAPAYQDRPKFLKNLGADSGWMFEDKSGGAGLGWQESFASPALGDYDNDGDLDLYLTAVYGHNHNVMYRNNGDWTFTNVTDSANVSRANTYSASWADFDNDGDLDLATGGRLYRNRGNAGHRLKVRLIGGHGVNSAAIGASVRLRVGDKTLTREVEGATGEGNQNDLTLHFGLGEVTGDIEAEVRWPGGDVQNFTLQADHLATIRYRPGK